MTLCQGIQELSIRERKKLTFSKSIKYHMVTKDIGMQFIFGYHRKEIETAHFLSKDDELLEVHVNMTGFNTVLVQSIVCTCILTMGFESDKRSLSESRNP